MTEPDHNEEPAPPLGALIGLLLVILLVGVVMFVMYRLHQSAQMQDCLASGRTNCAPIDTQQR